KIENSIDIISCFFSTKTDIRIDHSNYIIVQNGEPIYLSFGRNRDNKFEKHTDSINLNDQETHFENLNRYSYLWDRTFRGDKSILKIKNALHWYKKAEQSLKDEDKMLNYWIALENLLNIDSK